MDARFSAVRRDLGLVGGALVLALAAVTGTALLAVPLTEAPGTGGQSPSTGSGRAAGSSPAARSPAGPGSTTLPERLAAGGPLGVRYLPIQADSGYQADNGYQVLDLDRGQPGPVLVRFPTHGKILALPDGRLLCACATPVGPWVTATEAKLEVRIFEPDGRPVERFGVGTYRGSRDGWNPDYGPPFDTTAVLSPNSRFLLVSWLGRRTTGWRSGIDVVDLARQRLVQRVRLPDQPLVLGRARAFPQMPLVETSPGGRRLVITQYVIVGNSTASVDRWSTRFAAGHIEELASFETGPGTIAECARELEWEIASDEVFVGICSTGTGLVVRRVGLDGRPLGDTTVPDLLRNEAWQAGHVIDRHGGAYIVWDATTTHIVRIDLETGAIVASAVLSQTGSSGGGSPSGVLGAIGRWLAPPVVAKIPFGGSLELSPDGRRLYALAGSTIWLLDPRTLRVLDRWHPPAAVIGIALSRDGRLLFVVGLAGFDADWSRRPEQEASLTVYDAADGRLRLLLGRLGDGWLGIDPDLMP